MVYSRYGRAWSTTCRITITVDGSTNRIRITNGYPNTKTSISPLGERRTTVEFSKTKQQTLQKVNKNGPYLEYPSFVDVCVARLETMNVFTRSEYFPGTNADDQFDVTAMTLTMERRTNKTANKSYHDLNKPFTQPKLFTEPS